MYLINKHKEIARTILNKRNERSLTPQNIKMHYKDIVIKKCYHSKNRLIN